MYRTYQDTVFVGGFDVDMAYRYSFQGQEKDDEVKGEGNSINYKYRMHDPRIGRFFAVDPLSGDYPYYSPYAFSGNRVLDAVELEGLEPSSVHVYYVNNEGEKTGEFHRTAGERENDMGHLGDDFFAVTLPFLNLKSSQFELYSNVVIIYNVDSEEIENVFESMVESPIGKPKPKKQEQTARESTNWEKNGPLGVIIGEENADRFRNWESENLSGRAPLPLRLLVKVLPGPALVDAGFTLVTGNDMMSPARGEVNGLGYASSATTVGTGAHDLLGGTKKIAKFAGRFNVFLGVGIELFETHKEGGFDRVNNIEDDKEN